jgi:ureidoglycolate hydrolase
MQIPRVAMRSVLQIATHALTPESFERYGRLISSSADAPICFRPEQEYWRLPFTSEGPLELELVRYHFQDPDFSVLERHLTVTESRVPLGGRSCVMVVAPPTSIDRVELPPPESLRAFILDGTAGIMLWKGTWHALDVFPLKPPYIDFAFLTDSALVAELETTPNARDMKRTQVVDFQEQMGVTFRVSMPPAL